MAQLDKEKIKRLERGELFGTVATVFCCAVFIYFIVLFALSWGQSSALLTTVMWATAPALMTIGLGVAAYCNLKYGRGIERAINKYVLQVFVENAAKMHPEKDSLSFYVNLVGKTVEITVNGYKDKTVFDFSAFKRFSSFRRMAVLKAISDKLSATFCRLYERGGTYKSVDFKSIDATRGSKGRTVKIITDGVPDKKIMKAYLKTR